MCKQCHQFFGAPDKLFMCSVCYKYFFYVIKGNTVKPMASRKKSNKSRILNPPFHPNKPIIPNVSSAKRKQDSQDSNVANAIAHIAKTTVSHKTTNARQISSKKGRNKSKNTTKLSLHQKLNKFELINWRDLYEKLGQSNNLKRQIYKKRLIFVISIQIADIFFIVYFISYLCFIWTFLVVFIILWLGNYQYTTVSQVFDITITILKYLNNNALNINKIQIS